MSKSRKKKRTPKRVLALPDLEQSKAAVLNSLKSKSGQRTAVRRVAYEAADSGLLSPELAAGIPTLSKECAGLESVLGTGSPPTKAGGCWRVPIAPASCSACASNPFNSTRIIGSLPTFLARPDTSGPFRFRVGEAGAQRAGSC